MKCPQCGGEDWSTVDVCPGCLRQTTGPVTMRIHTCGTEDGYARAYREMEQQREARKARCVEKCQHPADFVCDYEDGTLHCLECIAEKFWQLEDILSGKHNVHTYHGALETIAHPERFLTGYNPKEVAKGALGECICGTDRTQNVYCRAHSLAQKG